MDKLGPTALTPGADDAEVQALRADGSMVRSDERARSEDDETRSLMADPRERFAETVSEMSEALPTLMTVGADASVPTLTIRNGG